MQQTKKMVRANVLSGNGFEDEPLYSLYEYMVLHKDTK